MVLAGLSSLVPSMAQNAQNPQRLRARVAAPTIKNGRPTDIYILSSNGPTVQFVESRESPGSPSADGQRLQDAVYF